MGTPPPYLRTVQRRRAALLLRRRRRPRWAEIAGLTQPTTRRRRHAGQCTVLPSRARVRDASDAVPAGLAQRLVVRQATDFDVGVVPHRCYRVVGRAQRAVRQRGGAVVHQRASANGAVVACTHSHPNRKPRRPVSSPVTSSCEKCNGTGWIPDFGSGLQTRLPVTLRTLR